jgi:hypothetical protein
MDYLKISKWNLIVALSNITCIFPIINSSPRNGINLLTLLVVHASFWSFISHLYENHKHNMGLKIHSKEISRTANSLNIMAAQMVLMYMVPMLTVRHLDWTGTFMTLIQWVVMTPLYIFELNPALFILTLCSAWFGIYAEYFSDTKIKYVITHSIWNFSIFILLDLWINHL